MLPELSIILHLRINFVFLCVYLAEVFLQQIIQANVNVSIIVVLQKVRNEPVSNLGVKHKVADHIELADEGRGVLAEVMEDLHYLV